MNKANILFFTNWGFLEGLIQSYTLPYIKAIQEIKREGTLYLVTEEKDYKNLLRKDIRI